jgi:hypothetical protein
MPDTKTSAGWNGWLDRHFNLRCKENWNVLPSVSYISVLKYIEIISFGVQGSLNKIEKYVNLIQQQRT